MTAEILITRPEHDEPTSYLASWCNPVIRFAEERGIKVIDFRGKRANRNDVEKLLSKKNPGFVFFNGHGDEKTICGHNDEPLIELGENEGLLKSKIVYSLACDSAKELGRRCVEIGTTAYIGYDDKFVIAKDASRTSTPLKDPIARSFSESSNEIPISLIDRKAAKGAYDRSQSKFEEWIEFFSSSAAPLGSETILWALVWDKAQQRLLGDETATI